VLNALLPVRPDLGQTDMTAVPQLADVTHDFNNGDILLFNPAPLLKEECPHYSPLFQAALGDPRVSREIPVGGDRSEARFLEQTRDGRALPEAMLDEQPPSGAQKVRRALDDAPDRKQTVTTAAQS
jgi:hypothetical protein